MSHFINFSVAQIMSILHIDVHTFKHDILVPNKLTSFSNLGRTNFCDIENL